MKTNRYVPVMVILVALVVGQLAGRLINQPLGASSSRPPAAIVSVPTAAELSSQFSKVSAAVDPTVVNINTETVVKFRSRSQPFEDQFDFFNRYFEGMVPRQQKRRSLGSGFLVDQSGYILTNFHVVNGADKIQVGLSSGEEYPAEVVGGDKLTDLAVIKIDAPKQLAAARFGNSDGMRRGDWVLAVGSPFGLERTVTAGIISATARPGHSPWQSFLQTDAAINQGNSGGPLLNLAGEVIGVNTAILTPSGGSAGIGFAVPSNTAIRVYNQVVKHGRVTRGAIGITMQHDAKPQALRALGASDGKGVIIQRVTPEDGPADRAGLQQGDVIVALNGQKVSEPADLFGLLADTAPGQTIEVQYLRDGKKRTSQLTVGDRNQVFAGEAASQEESAEDPEQMSLGLRVEGLPARLKQQLGKHQSGLLIRGVEPGSVADEAGLRAGDVLVEINKTAVTNSGQLRTIVGQLRSGMDVLFLVKRSERGTQEMVTLYLAATIP